MSASQPATAVATTRVIFVIAETYPYCRARSLPLKNIDTNEVEKGIIMPAPTPSMALTAMSCPIVPDTKYNAPLKRNSHKPMYNNLIYPTLLLIYPANRMKGIISSDGNVVSSCRSRSVALGNTDASFSSIGETARPGNDVSAATDHMPSSAQTVIYPLPVSTPSAPKIVLVAFSSFFIIGTPF